MGDSDRQIDFAPEVRPICLLLGALGGQGGGVLTDWLVEAARMAGFPAQATSIPGVAQRTGATTYYFELFPHRHPPADPVFCLFPSTGDVDLVVALEPTEAGRAMEAGYVTQTTTVISSTLRSYSTAEKSIAGDGTIGAAPILASLELAAKNLIVIDPTSAPGNQVNAVLFGAIIASSVLPLSDRDGRQAVEARGLAVAENLAGYEVGLEAGRGYSGPPAAQLSMHYDAPPPGFESGLRDFPQPLHALVGHALRRLADYQDEDYARKYLSRLGSILAADRASSGGEKELRLTKEVARRLAAWMSYEDVIRVAELKTRPGRLGRIRRELGAQPSDPVRIADFLSPGREQIGELLPAPLERLVPGGQHGDEGETSPGIHLTWPTSTAWGYAGLKFLAALKPIRPHTRTFAKEQRTMETWLEAIICAVPQDYDLACEVAELAVWMRGYGPIRSRGRSWLEAVLSNWVERLDAQPEKLKRQVGAALDAARNDPELACGKGKPD